MEFIWLEIQKFIKNNFVKILIGTTLIAGLYMWKTERQYNTQIENISDETVIDGLKLDSEPAHFRLYIEYPDNSITFTNSSLIEQYITRPEVLKEASQVTETNLDKIVEETENKAIVYYNESGETKVIGVTRDASTNLHEFYVNVGNEKDNLKIANYYYDYFSNGQIPFLENKTLYFIHDAKIKEYGDYLTFNSLKESNQKSLVKELIIGVVLGSVISLGLILVFSFLSKKLKYSFTYSIRESDYLYVINQKEAYKEELLEFISTPKNNNHVVIQEGNNSNLNNYLDELLNASDKDKHIQKVKSILEIENNKEIDRLIYIIQENETTRKWYNKQRLIDRLYNMPTVIVQINK